MLDKPLHLIIFKGLFGPRNVFTSHFKLISLLIEIDVGPSKVKHWNLSLDFDFFWLMADVKVLVDFLVDLLTDWFDVIEVKYINWLTILLSQKYVWWTELIALSWIALLKPNT